MSRSSGTGHPLYLRCGRCKRHRDWRTKDIPKLEATGKTRPCRRWTSGGIRQTNQYVQYRCLTCGFVGWSKHSDAGRLLKRLTIKMLD